MTDKEIIIDGVDVSGCKFYDKTANTYTCLLDTVSGDNNCYICKDNSNCHYKQLKRLEQENAELKAYMDVNEDFKTAWEELKAENEKLYEEKNCLHKIIDRLLENAGYSKDIASAEDFEDVYENMQYKNNKLEEYKQTLQEIKEIADAKCNECKYGKDGISCKYGDCGEAKLHLITQLIPKAEEE